MSINPLNLSQLKMDVMALELYIKTGKRLTRMWRPSDIKKVYGIKGSKEEQLKQLKAMLKAQS